MGAELAAAALQTGGNLLGGIANAFFTQKNNEQNREHSEYMYNKQRADALADREFENNYNSPAAQMARLKAAGLNPNLVYGNGAAQSSSVSTKQTNAQPVKGEPIRVPDDMFASIGNVVNQIVKNDEIRAQTDLLKQQLKTQQQVEDLTNQRVATERWKTENEQQKNQLGRANVYQKEQTLVSDIEYAKQKLRDLKAKTTFTINEDARRQIQTSQSVKESIQKILSMQSNTALDKYRQNDYQSRYLANDAKRSLDIIRGDYLGQDMREKIEFQRIQNEIKRIDLNYREMGFGEKESATRYIMDLIDKAKKPTTINNYREYYKVDKY